MELCSKKLLSLEEQLGRQVASVLVRGNEGVPKMRKNSMNSLMQDVKMLESQKFKMVYALDGQPLRKLEDIIEYIMSRS